MKILKMAATFGSLNRAVLEPGPGLTLIELPNEGGKSTWSAFIRAMFYGLPVQEGEVSYQPWSGAVMEGTIEMEWQGRSIALYRGPRDGTLWAAFSAVDTATGEPVTELTGENCGEVLLGVSREVYERTALISQAGALLTPSAELEKRVAALAATGEEMVSFPQAERRLKDWMSCRRTEDGKGRIPELEGALEELIQRRTNQSELLRQTQEAQQKKEKLEQERDQLEAVLRGRANQRRAQAEEEREAARLAVERAEQSLERTPSAEVLRQAQGDLSLINNLRTQVRNLERELPNLREISRKAESALQSDPDFGGLSAQQAAQKAEADHNEILRLKQHRWIGLLPLTGLILGGAAGYFLTPELMPPYLLILGLGAFSAVALGLIGLLRIHLRKGQANRILDRYGAETAEDLFELADRYEEKCAAAEEEKERLEETETRLEETEHQQKEKTRQLLELVHSFAPEVNEVYGVAAAISRALHQGEKLRMARSGLESAERLLAALPDPGTGGMMGATEDGEAVGKLSEAENALTLVRDEAARLEGELRALGEPTQLEAWEDELREELELRQEEYQALDAALDSLRRADTQLQERFSPVINQRAGEYLSLLTGGKYDTATLTRQFQALAREAGQSVSRSDQELSEGTAQQLYLALRLALCDLALPRKETCPILLDDVLDTFDDRRTKLALNCLMDLAQKRQVLLFTCHRRERTMLAGTSATIIFDR